MENNTENMDSLGLLKQDFQLLNRKLQTQQINNEKLIRKVLKSKMKWIDKYLYGQLFLLVPLGALVWLAIFRMGLVSLAFAVVSILIITASSLINIRINKVKGKGWQKEDLLSSRKILLRMKQARSKEILYSIPVSCLWLSWMGYEIYLHDRIGSSMIFASCILGGILGFCVGYAVYRKMQRTNDELIDEIDRFRQETDAD